MSCGEDRRPSSDLVLLWLSPAAIALIGPLAWKTPYATGIAQKRPKKKKKRPTQIKLLSFNMKKKSLGIYIAKAKSKLFSR